MKLIQTSITVDDYNLPGARRVVAVMEDVKDVVDVDFIHHLEDGFPSRFSFLLLFEGDISTADLEFVLAQFARVVASFQP